MCCSVYSKRFVELLKSLQCVAVCCSVLQCCSVVRILTHTQCVVVCTASDSGSSSSRCSVLQCVAVCCSVLQCVVVCCSMLQKAIRGAPQVVAVVASPETYIYIYKQCVAVLQCVAVYGSVLQCVAVYGSVLQRAVW